MNTRRDEAAKSTRHGNCKVGDYVITIGSDKIAAGAGIVVTTASAGRRWREV